MKKLIISFSAFMCFLLINLEAFSQSPCDTCTAPWGPVQYDTLINKKISEKPDTCRYTFIYKYRQRNCNGSIEVDLIDLLTVLQNPTGFCLPNFSFCYYSRKAATRSLVDFLGYPVTFSQEAACYTTVEVDPPQDFIECYLSPNEVVEVWYAYIKCDTNSCCRTTYIPNGDGTVNYQSDTVIDCTPGAVTNIPAFIIWYCKGQPFHIPVIQGQPINCQATCTQGAGTLFRKIRVLEKEEENAAFTIYPNPTKNDFTLKYKLNKTASLLVKVFNVQGQLVFSNLFQAKENSQVKINTSNWNSGIYSVRIEENGKLIESQKIQLLD